MSEQGAGADSTVVDEASGLAMAGDTSENCTSTSAVDVAHDADLEDAPDSLDALEDEDMSDDEGASEDEDMSDDEGASEDEDMSDDEGASEDEDTFDDEDTEDTGTSRRAALARGAREKLASLDMADMRSSFGGTAKQAYSGARTFFANHETTAVLIGMALAFLLVCIVFAIVYSFVIKGATISRDNLPEHVSNQLTPVENHELPHLSLHVLDITTDSYPTVRAKIEAVPEGENEPPALDAASFDVEACDAEDAPIEVTIESVEAGKRAGEYTITFAVEAGEGGAKQRIMLSLVPESGYRGGANIGFYTPSSQSDDA